MTKQTSSTTTTKTSKGKKLRKQLWRKRKAEADKKKISASKTPFLMLLAQTEEHFYFELQKSALSLKLEFNTAFTELRLFRLKIRCDKELDRLSYDPEVELTKLRQRLREARQKSDLANLLVEQAKHRAKIALDRVYDSVRPLYDELE